MHSPHNFHIPVMGLAYTSDSPIKVARFGISSVISIVEDRLIELLRRYYYPKTGQPYVPITTQEKDYRARRITDYLNLVQHIVNNQVASIKAQAFERGTELVKYFEMLPPTSKLQQVYRQMLENHNPQQKVEQQQWLREQVTAGSIDVNIMTKVDRNTYDENGVPIENGSDALAALRGYAASDLTNSSIVFSAGLNPRLFNYLESLRELDAKGYGLFDKKVVIKVSDYRSALIQGKYLAKKGVWVSEFRIESGLNCGGHAFATDGFLLGPIMQEFVDKREELASALFALYQPAVQARGGQIFDVPHPIKITVQGGIGTAAEAQFLQEQYGVESTGWGSPFLLCPEATTVDAETLQQLCAAGEKDIVLSNNSPLGVRFHYLKGTSGEKEKMARIESGKPGSPCTEKHLVSNTEFSKEPICTASLKYQKQKLAQLDGLGLSTLELEQQKKAVLDKECLCVGLINAAVKEYELPVLKKQEGVTVCPGPNTAYFTKVVSLQEMVDHIYGRTSIIDSEMRPHMFVKELQLYMDYLKEQLAAQKDALTAGPSKQMAAFAKNLKEGINYYASLSERMFENVKKQTSFCNILKQAEAELEKIMSVSPVAVAS